jgi:hypothetical protein
MPTETFYSFLFFIIGYIYVETSAINQFLGEIQRLKINAFQLDLRFVQE